MQKWPPSLWSIVSWGRKKEKEADVKTGDGNSQVQWLGLCASAAQGWGLITGLGTEIPHASGAGLQKKKGIKKMVGMTMGMWS